MNPDAIARTNPDIFDAVEQAGLVSSKGAQQNGDGSDSTDSKHSQPPEAGKKEQRESQADLLVKIVEDSGAEFFHTPTDEQFVSFSIGDHDETWPIRSRSSRRWITSKFYRATRKAPNSEAMQSALNVLEAKAACEGDEREVYLRAAWHEGAIYYDLADKEWRVVKIDAGSWEIVKQSPVKFRRYSNNLAQAEPEVGGDLAALWDFLNVKNSING